MLPPLTLTMNIRLQRAPDIKPEDLRLERGFAEGEQRILIPRHKHISGYRGFQRGNKCKENLPDLERTSELEILLRQVRIMASLLLLLLKLFHDSHLLRFYFYFLAQ